MTFFRFQIAILEGVMSAHSGAVVAAHSVEENSHAKYDQERSGGES